MLPINLNFIQKPENYKKKELMIYVALATKPENYKKKGIDDICGTSYKTRKLQKKYSCYYIYSCYPCTFRYCTNGRGSVPSVISKEHLPTSAAYSQPLVEANILTCAKTHHP